MQLEHLASHESRARARDGAEAPFEITHASFDLLLVRGTCGDRDGLSVAMLASRKCTLGTMLLMLWCKRRDFVCGKSRELGRRGGLTCVHFLFSPHPTVNGAPS
jgi:hypothetical protein